MPGQDHAHKSIVVKKSEEATCLILLGVLIACWLINNLIWLRIDTRPPRWDEAYYLTMSLKYHEALLSEGLRGFVGSLLTVDPMRPPLGPALAALAYLMLGRSSDAALAVNLLAFIVLILAVYGLGARLASPWSGLLAALFVSTYPGILGLSRVFYLDFLNTALVAGSLYLLVRTAASSRKLASAGFGALMGLGLLCRAFFPVFIIGPLTVSAYAVRREYRLGISAPEIQRSRLWVCGGIALLVCAAVALPWYAINLAPVMRRSLSAAYGAEAVGYGPSNPLTLRAVMSYLSNMVRTTPFGAVIFLLATGILWLRWSRLRPKPVLGDFNPVDGLSILFSSILIPVVFFSILRSQDLKNLLPVLPATAVVSAWGLSVLRPLALKRAVIGFGIAGSLFQLWIGTYGLQSFAGGVGFHAGPGQPAFFLFPVASASPVAFLNLPRRENWKIAEILSRISEVVGGPDGTRTSARPAVIAVVPDHPLSNRNNFEYFAALKGLPVRVERPGDPREPGGRDYRAQLLGVNVAVMKTGDPGPAWLNRRNDEMVKFLGSPGSGFVEIPPRFSLPDGSEAVLYAVPEASLTPEARPEDMSVPQSSLADDSSSWIMMSKGRGVPQGVASSSATSLWEDHQGMIRLHPCRGLGLNFLRPAGQWDVS